MPEPDNSKPPRRDGGEISGRRINGILVLDKPLGLTSMRAITVVRARAGGAKTGHAGTLDPLATGILVVALGRATKTIERLMATSKRYRAIVHLGAVTPTDDLESDPAPVEVGTPPGEADVRATLDRFQGRVMQRPPAHSAIKIGGRRAYELARKGKAIEMAARPIDIYSIAIRRYDWPRLEIDVHCGKGTYIRSLARDIGESLETGGYLESLRRTAVGPFDESMAVRLDDVPDPVTQTDLMSVEDALAMIDASITPRHSRSE